MKPYLILLGCIMVYLFNVLATMRSGAIQPKLFQGDIVETDAIRKAISGGLKRGATSNLRSLWPTVNGYANVPYVIDNSLGKLLW